MVDFKAKLKANQQSKQAVTETAYVPPKRKAGKAPDPEPQPLPSATGLRFDELPIASTFSRADMDEAIRLMTEDVEYVDQEAAIQAERKAGKARLEAIGRKYGVPGLRHGLLETRFYTETRQTLDKGRFVELGGDIDVLNASYKAGKEFVKVKVTDTSRAKSRVDSEE